MMIRGRGQKAASVVLLQMMILVNFVFGSSQ